VDQREELRQDIEATRASLDDKLKQLETKTRRALSLQRHVEAQPWIAVGAAVATGFVVGALRRRGEP
jgi:ElaB/YqjD/DUF883 family membrane-anchored ribosome-binding protein